MDDQRPDEILVQAAQAGDTDAFASIVRRYQTRVVAVAYSVLRDRDEAADVAQEVFLRVYKKLRGFSGKSRFYTWLHRISINMAIDRSRSRKRRHADSLDEVSEETGEDRFARIPDRDAGPMESAADAELEARIHEAIEKLRPKHRQVILLRDVQDLSYREIADILGCSLGTVMSRLHYARDKLKEAVRPLMAGYMEGGNQSDENVQDG